SIDLANFRRRMLATGRIEETGERRREGRHRPAAVYRYTPGDPDPVAPYDVVRQRLASLTQSSALSGTSAPSLDLRMREALSPLGRA
ncbi:NrtR DNA-binding winged helix domain-containing protein, partial [Bifidobacterium pullorum]|uniref:NrtR DNA-binding winged helix domain-containing protein n=1 Tax=Bifidobacterium pullorum TaxID=78448 RepID=UPI003AB7356F